MQVLCVCLCVCTCTHLCVSTSFIILPVIFGRLYYQRKWWLWQHSIISSCPGITYMISYSFTLIYLYLHVPISSLYTTSSHLSATPNHVTQPLYPTDSFQYLQLTLPSHHCPYHSSPSQCGYSTCIPHTCNFCSVIWGICCIFTH